MLRLSWRQPDVDVLSQSPISYGLLNLSNAVERHREFRLTKISVIMLENEQPHALIDGCPYAGSNILTRRIRYHIRQQHLAI